MIKGAQKQMIVLRTADSRYFDEAYFVLRREIDARPAPTNEMLCEADRILRESTLGSAGEARPKRRRGVWLFGLGFFAGGGMGALLLLLLL